MSGESAKMTIILDEIRSEDSSDVEATNSVLCSWCGEIINFDGNVVAVSMCQSCHARMLAEFQLARQELSSPHASDR
jgi:hypothetical protein